MAPASISSSAILDTRAGRPQKPETSGQWPRRSMEIDLSIQGQKDQGSLVDLMRSRAERRSTELHLQVGFKGG